MRRDSKSAFVTCFTHTVRRAGIPNHSPRDRLKFSTSSRTRNAKLIAPIKASAVVTAPAWGIWTVLLAAAAGGLVSNRTKVGAAISPPVVSTLITLFLGNVGLLPAAHPAYAVTIKVLVPLSVPLLLFSADLRRVARETGRLLPAFIVGSIATAISIVLAFKVVPLAPALGADEAWKVAAALCARHIGGAVNFVSTADALDLSSAAVTTALAADNVVLTAYFLLLFALARNVNDPALDRAKTNNAVAAEANTIAPPAQDSSSVNDAQPAPTAAAEDEIEEGAATAKISMEKVGVALTLSSFICYLGRLVAPFLPVQLGVIPTITLIALVLSTAVPKVFGRISKAGNACGIFFLQIFFAATGASGSISTVVKSAPLLFAFIIFHLAIHITILFVVGKFGLRLHPAELLVASNANVGGPATALAMTAANDWKSLVVPSLLIGVLGYSIATFVGLSIGHLVLKPL